MTDFIKTPIGLVARRPLNIKDTGVKELLDNGNFYSHEALANGTINSSPLELKAMAHKLGFGVMTIKELVTLMEFLRTQTSKEERGLYESLSKNEISDGIYNSEMLAQHVIPRISTNKGIELITPRGYEFKNRNWRPINPIRETIADFPPTGTSLDCPTFTVKFNAEDTGENGLPRVHRESNSTFSLKCDVGGEEDHTASFYGRNIDLTVPMNETYTPEDRLANTIRLIKR